MYADTLSWDVAGRRTSIAYPTVLGGGQAWYSYAANGDLSAVAAFGQSTTYMVSNRGELLRRTYAGGQTQALTYDSDGRMIGDTVKNGADFWRAQRFFYDARGLRTSMTNTVPGVGNRGTEANVYDHLGQLTSSSTETWAPGFPLVSSTNTYVLDAFGNMAKRSGAEASIGYVNGYYHSQSTDNNGAEWNWYVPGTGRLWYTKNFANPDTTGQVEGGGGRPAAMNRYDSAGNLIWTGLAVLHEDRASGFDWGKAHGQSERRMYYGPDGKLRAVDARALSRTPWAAAGTGARGFARSFEEYRYDALGRRVATMFEQTCDDDFEHNRDNAPCRTSGIRRTIWDGSQELGELQLPTGQIENDTHVGQGSLSTAKNLAPFFGAVAYLFDGQVDRPLAVKRLRYSNLNSSNVIVPQSAFVYYPIWNVQGAAPFAAPGSPLVTECPLETVGGAKVTCVHLVFDQNPLAYRDVSTVWRKSWQGTLLQDKVGAGGLMFRRNRYYDSKSGRFTQEDPIGLAGGLNLYGYANGDPINLSDPFGLSADTLSSDMKGKLGDACSVADCSKVNVVTPDDIDNPIDALIMMGVTNNERALTLGNRMYFPRGLNAESSEDVALVAHELTHVFQYQILSAMQGSAKGFATYMSAGIVDQARYSLGLGNPYTGSGLLEPMASAVDRCFSRGSCAGSVFTPPR